MTPYQKIMRAYNAPGGYRGVRLTAEDVYALGGDGAIETRATLDDCDDCERRGHRIARGARACYCGERIKS
jgi:hypothetical protein